MKYVRKNSVSRVGHGLQAEEKVSLKLGALGLRNKRMTFKHPFDIELENGKRIDVKVATVAGKINVGVHKYEFYRFYMAKSKKQDFTDFFILVVGDTYYVIPYDVAPNDALFLYNTGYK